MYVHTRAVALFGTPAQLTDSSWNVTLKMFYIISSIYTLVLMTKIFPRTRERENSWKLGGAVLLGSALLAPFVMMIFRSRALERWNFQEVR